MTFATALSLSLACLGMCAAADNPPLACNLNAMCAAQRPRYNELVTRLRSAIAERTELANGYTYKLTTETLPLPEVAEWISMERLCCPFFNFQLDVKSNGDAQLTMRGPAGAKAVLREEFPTK